MADTDLSTQDVLDAQTFMQAFLLQLIPDADVTEGSAEYDHLVKGFSYLFAYLRKQATTNQARQSLLQLVNLPADQNVDEAADAILSNLFQSRGQGQFSRGPALIHLSARVDVVVRTTSRFFRTRTQYFLVDSSSNYVIPASRLSPTLDATGAVIDWVGKVPLVASQAGTAYNITPGRFVNFERFNPFVTYVENQTTFGGALDVENTSDFVARASVAVSLQALINARSNSALLSNLFPIIESVLTIGNGDPEMVRDVVQEQSSGVTLHVGGKMDILVKTPIQSTTEELTVGALFKRPDDLITIFRHDSTVDFTTGFGLVSGKPVIVGDVLTINAGLPEAPFQYMIVAVTPQTLQVSPLTPFSIATDEIVSSPPVLTYSIGNIYPLFTDITVDTGAATTSRSISAPNTVMLTGQPVYAVTNVEIAAVPAGYAAYADPTTNTLIFSQRVNVAPAIPTPGNPLQYQIVVLNPSANQSAQAVTQLILGWPGAVFDGSTVAVTYDTLGQFTDIDTFVSDLENRPAVSNTITRAANPVYLSLTVPYSLNSSPVNFLNSTPSFDEVQAEADLVQFINSYNGTNVMDVSLLSTEARNNSNTVAAIYPFTVYYVLLGPDGRVFHFSTTDRITAFPDGTHGAVLLNPTDFDLDPVNYFQGLAALMATLGVSDRNVRYLTDTGNVTFQQVV